jgi:glutathione S-transferase
MQIVLRYFPIVGRAQPLRHALLDAGQAFEDLRVEPDQWRRQRAELGFGGPFRGLPTLTWAGETISETLPIATFLARRLGQSDGLDDAAIAQREAICSNCYLEVLVRVGEILWVDVLYPGVDLARTYPRLLARMIEKLALLDAHLPPGVWIGGARPVIADFFAAEALEAVRYLLAPGHDAALRAKLPRLAYLADQVRTRPAIAASVRPAQFTVRTDEGAQLGDLRAIDVTI